MEEVVRFHDTKKQPYRGDHGGFVYRFMKSIAGKRVTVIAKAISTRKRLATSKPGRPWLRRPAEALLTPAEPQEVARAAADSG